MLNVVYKKSSCLGHTRHQICWDEKFGICEFEIAALYKRLASGCGINNRFFFAVVIQAMEITPSMLQ